MMNREQLKVDDRLFYFGPAGLGLEVRVTHLDENDENVGVSMMSGEPVIFTVPLSTLYPLYPFAVGGRRHGEDEDVAQMVHHSSNYHLITEIMKHRAGWRYILEQEGDDLCWRDFYTVAAALMPEGDAALARLKSMPPRPVMLYNCHRFIDSLLAGDTSCYKAESPEAILVAIQNELDTIKDAFLTDPEDRLYRAGDSTWWRRDSDGRLVEATAPDLNPSN